MVKKSEPARRNPLSIRPTGDQLDRWQAAADQLGIKLPDWIRLVCDAASGRSDLSTQIERAIEVRALVERAQNRSSLDEEDATKLAVDETRAARSEARSGR